MKPLGIDMVWVTVKDFKEAKNFFSNTLGMTIAADAPEHSWAEFETPHGSRIGICEESEHNPLHAGDNAVVCITVENAVAAKQELEEKNIRCWDIHEIPGHVKMFLMQDESHNYYQIVQLLDV
jgi:predicted enzyme related to lactoylglutathione lyase